MKGAGCHRRRHHHTVARQPWSSGTDTTLRSAATRNERRRENKYNKKENYELDALRTVLCNEQPTRRAFFFATCPQQYGKLGSWNEIVVVERFEVLLGVRCNSRAKNCPGSQVQECITKLKQRGGTLLKLHTLETCLRAHQHAPINVVVLSCVNKREIVIKHQACN